MTTIAALVKTVRSGLLVVSDHLDRLQAQSHANRVNDMRKESDALVADAKTLLGQAKELRDEIYKIE